MRVTDSVQLCKGDECTRALSVTRTNRLIARDRRVCQVGINRPQNLHKSNSRLRLSLPRSPTLLALSFPLQHQHSSPRAVWCYGKCWYSPNYLTLPGTSFRLLFPEDDSSEPQVCAGHAHHHRRDHLRDISPHSLAGTNKCAVKDGFRSSPVGKHTACSAQPTKPRSGLDIPVTSLQAAQSLLQYGVCLRPVTPTTAPLLDLDATAEICIFITTNLTFRTYSLSDPLHRLTAQASSSARVSFAPISHRRSHLHPSQTRLSASETIDGTSRYCTWSTNIKTISFHHRIHTAHEQPVELAPLCPVR